MPLPTVLLAMVAAQLFDLGTFMTMIGRLGPQAEGNPIVAGLLSEGGMGAILAAKLALIVLIGATTVVLAARGDGRARRAWTILTGCAIVAGLFGGWSNAITIGLG